MMSSVFEAVYDTGLFKNHLLDHMVEDMKFF